MAGTIIVGYDGHESAQHALARAIEEAQKSASSLVVVAIAEMPLNPEGLQNYGTLDDSPVQMMPLVEPPEARAGSRRGAPASRGGRADGGLRLVGR